MEPGREGREDCYVAGTCSQVQVPQWSPAEKAGKTTRQYHSL